MYSAGVQPRSEGTSKEMYNQLQVAIVYWFLME